MNSIARQMVGRWGMSAAIGPLTVLPGPTDVPVPWGGDGFSPATAQLVDAEVRRIVEESYEVARDMLREHRGALDALAHALLERETLDEDEAYRIAGVTHGDPLPVGPG